MANIEWDMRESTLTRQFAHALSNGTLRSFPDSTEIGMSRAYGLRTAAGAGGVGAARSAGPVACAAICMYGSYGIGASPLLDPETTHTLHTHM
jgi:hypothetical protein